MATNNDYDAFEQQEEDLRNWHAHREAKGKPHGPAEERAYLEFRRSQRNDLLVPVPQQRTQAVMNKFNAAISLTGPQLPAARPGAPTSTGARPRVQSPKEMKVN